MKKGTKTLAALLIGATFALGLGACQPKQPKPTPTPTPVHQTYAVTIANKTALQAEWPANGGGRKVEINVEPKANVAQLVKDGDVVITSSNTAVLNIAGLMAMPVAAGQATITVTSGENSDTVEVEISEALTIKTKYGVAHEGTEEDPLTNEEAIAIANHADYNTDGGHEDLYVRGIVSSFYHAPGSRTDGAVSWYLTPATGQTKKFEVYKCYKQGTGEASYLTDSDVWVGADVLAHGRFTLYNGQAETDGATYVRAWGTPPPARVVVEETFANSLAAGKALEDGADTYNYYKFDAYVTKKRGNDYFLTATKNEAITDAKTNTIEIYFGNTAPAEAIANKLTKGAKVTVKMILKNYHGQVENLLALTADDITVVEAGGTWDVTPEPAVETRTLAEFIAGENTKAKAYNVTFTVKSFKDGATTNDQFGNMVATDGTNDLVIYGATMTASALAWNDADAYVFTNPKDFQSNTTSNAIAIGDTLTMKLIRCDYKTTKEGCGVITNIVPGGGGGGQQTAITTMQGIYESGKAGDAIDVKGVYVGAYGNKTNEWYVANGDYAVYLYQVNIPSGLAVGDSVRIQGKLGVFKGLIQVAKDGATVTKIDETITYNSLSYTGGAFTKAQLSRPVQLTGTVKEGKAIASGSNTSVVVTVGTTDVTIYVKKSYGLDYTALNTALGTTGATVTLKGFVGIYDGAATVDYATSTGYQVVNPSVVA
jgi:hypothetical protein